MEGKRIKIIMTGDEEAFLVVRAQPDSIVAFWKTDNSLGIQRVTMNADPSHVSKQEK